MKWIDVENSLKGLYAWQVRYENGALRIDFGEPHLRVREPKEHLENLDLAVQKLGRRRIVTPTGVFHLFVDNCDWEATAFGYMCKNSDSDREQIVKCLSQVSGQKFAGASFILEESLCIFNFDLGGKLIMKPNCSVARIDTQLWTVFLRDSSYISYGYSNRFEFSAGGSGSER